MYAFLTSNVDETDLRWFRFTSVYDLLASMIY